MITAARRKEYWDWCREHIDRECIYRVDANHPPIPSKAPGGTYVWQFYLRRATLNPHFAERLGWLFWDIFEPRYRQEPFQVCACQPSGPPIAFAIAHRAHALNINRLNVFVVRREPKTIGTDNWFDGRITREPVLLVDDVAASAPFLPNAAARVLHKLGLPLYRNYFTIINKVGRGFSKDAQHTENYLDNELVALYTINNFCRDVEQFEERYACRPVWTGAVH